MDLLWQHRIVALV